MRTRKFFLAFAVAAAAVATSCVKDQLDPQDKPEVEITGQVFEANHEVLTKSTLVDLTPTWAEGDKIFVSGNKDAVCTFVEENKFQTEEDVTIDGPFYAIYPAAEGHTVSDAGVFTATVPSLQKIDVKKEQNVAQGALVAVAQSETPQLQFKNAVGLVKINIARNDIMAVKIEGLGENEFVAGQFTMKLNGDKEPEIALVEGTGVTSVTLNTVENYGMFTPGEYYATVLPCNLSGIKVTFSRKTFTYGENGEVTGTGSETISVQKQSSTEIKRNAGTNLGTFFTYEISTPADLLAWNKANAKWTVWDVVTLKDNIDCSTIKSEDWTPNEFKGVFDGNGKTITNFSPNAFTDNVNTSQDANYPSLFGVLYGSCKDLTVKGSVFNVGTKNGVGIIGGYIGTAGKPALVENVHLVDCEINGTGNTYGGIGGNGREATIRNCSVDVVIRAGGADVGGMIGIGNGTVVIEDSKAEVDLAPQTNPGSNMRYGAILGYHKGTALTINNCQTSGIISCGYSCNCSGGIVAYSGSTSSTNIAQCKSAVAIKNDSGKQLSNSGGIVGCHGSAGTCTIADCYSIGDMEVRQTSGGLVGRHEKGTLSITDSYSTSSLNGYSGLGSILGQSASAGTLILTDCIAWAPSISANRDANDKYSSGAIVGAASGKSTITNCVRRSDMAFKDPYRTLTEHGNLNGVVHSGAANQQAYDGKPTSESTVSAAAKAAGWSETVWDLTGDLPELKIFK